MPTESIIIHMQLISTYRVPDWRFLSKFRASFHLSPKYHFVGAEMPLQIQLAPIHSPHLVPLPCPLTYVSRNLMSVSITTTYQLRHATNFRLPFDDSISTDHLLET